jgi:hypothetical protein
MSISAYGADNSFAGRQAMVKTKIPLYLACDGRNFCHNLIGAGNPKSH